MWTFHCSIRWRDVGQSPIHFNHCERHIENRDGGLGYYGELDLSGGLWVTSDVLTALRMNLKTAYIGTTAPSSPQDGQIWIDISTNPPTFKVYDLINTKWDQLGRITVSATEPVKVAGDFWIKL